MNPLVHASIIALTVIFALTLSYIYAKKLELRRKEKFPMDHPFIWGYFFAIINILLGFTLPIIYFSNIDPAMALRFNPESIIIAVPLFCISGYFLLKKKKWAWMLLSILWAYSIIFPIVNYNYGSKRWKEFN